MQAIIQPLRVLARQGRFVLVIGLALGILLPNLALALKPWLGEMIVGLLFLAALRIGPREALGRLTDLPRGLSIIGIYQIVIPIAFFFIFLIFGWSGPIATGLVLMAAASSISGSANITLMTGNDPAPPLRLLVLGTAALPFTVLPVFWLLPELGSAAVIVTAALRLLVIIAVAAGAAWALRHFAFPSPSAETLETIDGLSAFGLAFLVIGLMSAIGPAIGTEPLLVLWTLLAAFAANFLLQVGAWLTFSSGTFQRERVGYAIVCGNRNMALFLAALPAGVTDPLLLFIGCYQIPMFLTPLLLGWLYRRN